MAETEKTPEEIAREIVRQYHGARVTPYNLVGAIAAALTAKHEARIKAEAEKRDWQQAHITLSAQYREKQTFAHEQVLRAEKAEAERDEARADAADASLREKAAENARLAAGLRASRGDRRGWDRAIKAAADVVSAEPEMPGDPPDEVVEAMIMAGPVANARAAVRATKKSVAAAILAIPYQPEEPKP